MTTSFCLFVFSEMSLTSVADAALSLCYFDSITVIIMEGTASDNYTYSLKKWYKTLFIVNPVTDK